MSTDLIADLKEAAGREAERAYRQAGFSGPLRNEGGRNLVGLCPFHADREPSFKIATAGEHAGTFKCFGCGIGGSVIDFYLRLSNRETPTREVLEDLARRLGVSGNGKGKEKPRAKGRAVGRREHPILDAQGREVARHVRIDLEGGGKRFEWWRDGKKGLRGLRTESLPLYRLAEVLQTPPEAAVIVTEGEKAAGALAERGFLAVGTVCGAQVTPAPEVLRPLAGRPVYLWPDNDDAGRRHMDGIAARLAELGTPARVMDWPQAGPKEDAADFLYRGGTREELESLLASAPEWQAPDPGATGSGSFGGFSPTDLGNAQRLVARHGADLRYCYPAKKWYVWEGRRWHEDQTGEVERRAKDTVQQIGVEAAGAADGGRRTRLLKHALASESEVRRKAMIASAQSEPGIPILPADFDPDPWLLNCEDGLIDLRTLALQPHRREAYCTKLAPVGYDPGADCPTWRAFLNRVTGEDQDLQDFLQRAVGYTLTGDTREQCFFLLYGTGANGKSTFLETLQALLGDYARKCDFTSFLLRRNDSGPRNDLAALAGARLVVAVEADAGRRLAEAVVKELTGGDAVTARFLYGEYFTFTPQFKLWLGTNHKPVIRGTDRAIWRRIRLVPFTVTIPPEEQDPELKEKLCGELSGILTWALEGCAAWRWHRLGECQAVHAATESYREESDVLADFLASECVQAPGVAVLSRDLYQRYEAWCEANGERALTQRNLGRALEERGFLPQRRHGGTRWWAGVGLLTAPTGDAGDADEPEPEKSG